MLKARLGQASQLITVSDLLKKYGSQFKEQGVEIFCPLCGRPVFVYGAHSLSVTARFHHPEGSSECAFSHASETRYAWLYPKDIDLEAGLSLKEHVFKEENLKQIYAFCHYLCRKQVFSTSKFCKLIKLADQKNIWFYKNLPFWAVGFILMTLDDFEGQRSKDKTNYIYRFVFESGKPKTVEDLWEKQGKYQLSKVFGDTGKMINFPPENPFLVSEETFEELSKDQEWLQLSHINSLMKCSPPRQRKNLT